MTKGVTIYWPNGAYVVIKNDDLHILLEQFGMPNRMQIWERDEQYVRTSTEITPETKAN